MARHPCHPPTHIPYTLCTYCLFYSSNKNIFIPRSPSPQNSGKERWQLPPKHWSLVGAQRWWRPPTYCIFKAIFRFIWQLLEINAKLFWGAKFFFFDKLNNFLGSWGNTKEILIVLQRNDFLNCPAMHVKFYTILYWGPLDLFSPDYSLSKLATIWQWYLLLLSMLHDLIPTSQLQHV